MNQSDLDLIVHSCRINLDLRNARLDDEYYYCSLPLCVIDTIYSIGARYQSTELTVKRFCAYFGLERLSRERYPDPASQVSISEFLAIYERMGIEAMADQVYQNRQRTSTRSGILKAEAVWRVSDLLHAYGVEVLQDVDRVMGARDFEEKFKAIPGQASGISLRYFYMLVGSDDYVKPDRMIGRFIRSATNKDFSVDEMHRAIVAAAKILSSEYPHLTPRLLDNLIWNYQRQI
jgi:hypothetical protein